MGRRPYSNGKSGSHRQALQSPPHPQHSHLPRNKLMQWDPLMLFLLVPVVVGSLDNFEVSYSDVFKAFMEMATGVIELSIGVLCIPVKFRKWNVISALPPNVRIFRETRVIVILSYVLLLDIDVSYLLLVIFPGIAILFLYALSNVLLAERRKTGGCTECDEEKTIRTPVGLALMVMVPFLALFAMAQLLPDDATNRFTISQFLLFMGTTLAAMTRMMRKQSVGMPPRVAQASELLHKISLVVLLVTAHTVAAELLGETVILTFMLEVAPVLLWFSIHLDREYPVISVYKLEKYRNWLVAVVSAVIRWAYRKTPSLLSSNCATAFMSCWVSGFLAYYLLFMLHQWTAQQSGKEEADAVQSKISAKDKDIGSEIQVSKNTVSSDKVVQSENQVSEGIESSDKVVQSKKGQAGSFTEGVLLLQFWAGSLLIGACVLALVLLYLAGPAQIFNLNYLSQPLFEKKITPSN